MARGETSTHTQSAYTLLVVDDERSLRFGIGEWARDAGFLPLEASDGHQALELVREHPVDVVNSNRQYARRTPANKGAGEFRDRN